MGSREEAVKLYNEYKKKYNLPDLEEIEKELLDYLKEPTNIVSFLLFKLSEKVWQVVTWIQRLFLPTPTLIGKLEREKIKEIREKKEEDYLTLLKKLVLINRKLAKGAFLEEKEAIEIFLECYNEYKKLKKEIVSFIDENIRMWEEIVKEKEENKKKQIKFYG